MSELSSELHIHCLADDGKMRESSARSTYLVVTAVEWNGEEQGIDLEMKKKCESGLECNARVTQASDVYIERSLG